MIDDVIEKTLIVFVIGYIILISFLVFSMFTYWRII